MKILTLDPLVERCKAQEKDAQRELYDKYKVAMFNLAKRMMGNKEDAQDVLQNAFIAAFQSIQSFDNRVTFGSWLKRIVINKSLTAIKQKEKLNWDLLDFDIPMIAEHAAIEIDVDSLNSAIENLPAGSRMVFTLKAMEGFDHEEISNYLKISVSTSKSQFKRAKDLLRSTLSKSTIKK